MCNRTGRRCALFVEWNISRIRLLFRIFFKCIFNFTTFSQKTSQSIHPNFKKIHKNLTTTSKPSQKAPRKLPNHRVRARFANVFIFSPSTSVEYVRPRMQIRVSAAENVACKWRPRCPSPFRISNARTVWHMLAGSESTMVSRNRKTTRNPRTCSDGGFLGCGLEYVDRASTSCPLNYFYLFKSSLWWVNLG